MLSTNEIQLVNYLKTNSNGGQGNQRSSINAGEKKHLVVRESVGNNSQLHNTKQIIKLIKKSQRFRVHLAFIKLNVFVRLV